MNHTRYFVTLDKIKSALIVFHTLQRCSLNYGFTVWGIKADRLDILQKKTVRIVTKSNFIAHTDPLTIQTVKRTQD